MVSLEVLLLVEGEGLGSCHPLQTASIILKGTTFVSMVPCLRERVSLLLLSVPVVQTCQIAGPSPCLIVVSSMIAVVWSLLSNLSSFFKRIPILQAHFAVALLELD